MLPDVKEKHVLYNFKGEESWQPLMVLPEKKCQRCGLYEADTIKHDDVFDEWEFCSSDFVDGRYVRFKEREFNATFICPGCTASADSNQTSIPNKDVEHKKLNVLLAVLITLLASILAAGVAYVIYRYWQKRKREQDQVRFLKLFDDGDDIEVELSLGHI